MLDRETLFNVLNNINNWIMNCDTKTSIILSGHGVVFSIILVTDVIDNVIIALKVCFTNLSCANLLFLIFLFGSLLCLIIGLWFNVSALIPRIDKQKDSLMFFSLVSVRKTIEDYQKAAYDYAHDDVIDDLLNQIYAASKICTKKFKFQKIGLIFSVLGWTLVWLWIIICFIRF